VNSPNSRLTYIDLFAGCGGLSLGLHNAGWKGLFAIEKNKDAFLTFKHNLIDKLNHFDWPKWLEKKPHNINTVLSKYRQNLEALKGKVDLVTGGPPCQGFSTEGERNEEDERNGLIKSYIRFIKIVRPKIIFFENVRGFTMEFDKNKTKGKKYSEYVLDKLNKGGYDVHGKMVDFSEYGVPQKRCRFILVGVRKDLIKEAQNESKLFFDKIYSSRQEFLISKDLDINTNLEDAISDLLKSHGTVESPDSKSFKAGIYSKEKSRYQVFIRDGKKENEIADSHRFVNHTQKITKRFEFFLQNEVRNTGISLEARKKFNLKKRTIITLDGKMITPTITSLPDDYIHYCEPRVFTVREYARVQSFPDTYEFKGKYTTGGKCRTQEVPRYTQIGNAIPPLFGEQTGIALKQLLSNNGG
jgi:DNA (cytosine-5)-methyltransferase 1